MSQFLLRAACAAVALAASPVAHAAITDYAFQLVASEVAQGDATLIVRLVDKRDGKPVPNAVIFDTRLDMAPDGMETMTSTVAPEPGGTPGEYRFKADITMEGGWRLSLAAKVQGEAGTVVGRLTFKARS